LYPVHDSWVAIGGGRRRLVIVVVLFIFAWSAYGTQGRSSGYAQNIAHTLEKKYGPFAFIRYPLGLRLGRSGRFAGDSVIRCIGCDTPSGLSRVRSHR
jgi:hypothetical protein